MPYTFVPEKKHAKVYSRNSKISTKTAAKLCRVIKNKPLSRAKRLLNDLVERKRALRGKYYTKTANELLMLINSCERNAEFLDLDTQRLFVHASAHTGTTIRRRRRRGSFGSKMKTSNVEVMLIERGKSQAVKIIRTKKDLDKVVKEVAEKVKEKKLAEAKEQEEKKQENKEAVTVTT